MLLHEALQVREMRARVAPRDIMQRRLDDSVPLLSQHRQSALLAVEPVSLASSPAFRAPVGASRRRCRLRERPISIAKRSLWTNPESMSALEGSISFKTDSSIIDRLDPESIKTSNEISFTETTGIRPVTVSVRVPDTSPDLWYGWSSESMPSYASATSSVVAITCSNVVRCCLLVAAIAFYAIAFSTPRAWW